MLPTIETERLVLRPLQMADAAQVQTLASDYEIYKSTLNVPHPYELELAKQWIASHEQDVLEKDLYNLGIFDKQSDCLVGVYSLGIFPSKNMGEVGYWIGKKYWNLGYGTEATKAFVDYGFSKLHLNRVYGRYLEINPASRRVMEKAGMIYEGTLKDVIVKDGTYHSVGYLGYSRAEWLKKTGRSNLRLAVRSAELRDASGLHYIQQAAFQEDVDRYGKRLDCPAFEEMARIKNKIENGGYFIVEENGRLIGGCHLRSVDTHKMRLARIYIDPAYHSLGIGRFFIEKLEAMYPQMQVWELDTPYQNYRNHYFYESLGYVKIGENKLDEGLTLFDYQKCRQEMNHVAK